MEDKNPFVAIGASLAGIFMVIAVLFLIFAKDQLNILVPIVWAFVIMGVFLGLFASITMRKK